MVPNVQIFLKAAGFSQAQFLLQSELDSESPWYPYKWGGQFFADFFITF
jgi:hypothetical protein